jgi:hypothetical protein
MSKEPHRRARAALVAAALLAITAVASACSDSSDPEDEQSATEAWAGDVCSTVGSWLDAITDAQAALTDPADLSADTLGGAFDGVVTATDTLITDLGDLGPPETEAGDEAAAEVSTLSDDLEEQRAAITAATDQAAGTVPGLLSQVSTVSGAIAAMLTDVSAAVDNLRQLDGADELEQAFQDASACQDLRASATPSE